MLSMSVLEPDELNLLGLSIVGIRSFVGIILRKAVILEFSRGCTRSKFMSPHKYYPKNTVHNVLSGV